MHTRNESSQRRPRPPAVAGVFLALLLAAAGVAEAAPEPGTPPQPVRLGVVTDGPSERDAVIAEAFRKEIHALLDGEFAVEDRVVRGEWTVDSIAARLDQLLADPEIDVVLAAGLTASSLAVGRRDLPKPVIAPYVVDFELQGAPFVRGASGVPNLCYVTYPPALDGALEQFRELVPFERVAVLRAPLARPAARLFEEKVAAVAQQQGIGARVIEAPGAAAEILALLPADVEAVFVGPLLNVTDAEMRRLARGLVERRIPSFSALPGDVELGILASIFEPTDVTRLARRVAIDLQRILLGEEAGSLPVLFERGRQLSINMATARAIGVHPSFAMEADARLIDEQRTDVERIVTLSGVVREAMASNLDLRALERGVAASREDVRSARAQLLPRLDLSASGAVIDQDRGSLFQTQRSLRAGVGLQQLLYSDRAWGGLEIQKQALASREQELEQLRLDVTRAAASAYLGVLQAKTLERIVRENLALTRQNLERARTRVQIGMASRSEVYRWEAQLATNRSDLIAAVASRNVAEIEVNRILDRPLEEPFVAGEVGLEDPILITSDERLLGYLRSRPVFRLFRAFNVLEALGNAPELRQLDAGLAAQERALLSTERAFYLPEVGLEARVDNRLYQGGAGADEARGAFDDWDWQIGVQASIPLFTSGERPAARARARQELEELRTRRRAVSLQVEQRVRSTLHVAGASFAGIDLARESAAAARRSLELVSDSYARGAVSIIELLDAQNAFIVAEFSAANALYAFLVDLVEVERAVGKFDFFATPAEREAYFQRLEAYARDAAPPGEGR